MKTTNIQNLNFDQALSERYLSYALSTIVSRSLPDVRDGLKPVHRRLLYAMHALKLDPKSGFKKCARIVGDVIGKYHPHGEVAVYDALVRMAQEFSSRYPTINGQGNFGSIDGDSQAAMRYTEAKLTDYASYLLEDIENDTVDFRSNYDGSDSEPVVLPASIPNLLANGSEGIAVGMATAIPPHNILELLNALIHLTKKPSAKNEDLLAYVLGPDFPTGGILVESNESIASHYKNGKGSFRLRAKWHEEEVKKNKKVIVITEIPYQVQKKSLIERLAELFNAKQLPFLDDIEDMSAEDIRIILTPKSKDTPLEAIMEILFKETDLEIRYHMNLNVIDANANPGVMDLQQILSAFLEHRKITLSRKLRNRLSAIERRLEILAGLMVVYLNLDEVIRIIREEDEPKAIMISKWGLSDTQAESILNMRLRSLRRIEEIEIEREKTDLTLEHSKLTTILADEKNVLKELQDEFVKLQKHFAKNSLYARKTQITSAVAKVEISIDDLKEKEQLTIGLSKIGWLKAMKGHSLDGFKVKEGDEIQHLIEVQSTDKIIFFTTYGKSYAIGADKVSRGKGDGDPIKLTFELGPDERILTMLSYKENTKYFLASNESKGFIVNSEELLAQNKNGKTILTVDESFAAITCEEITNKKYVVTMGENRRLLAFPLQEVPELRKGKGPILQKLKAGKLVFARLIKDLPELEKIFKSSITTPNIWLGKRASQGRLILSKTIFDA
jgi:topoisomerase-4 subunit A